MLVSLPAVEELQSRECPMCGGSMQRKQTQSVIQIPGNPKETTKQVTEWVCPDCEYFEEED
jgi:YgiT-type zinc finger domain-containing protein